MPLFSADISQRFAMERFIRNMLMAMKLRPLQIIWEW
jgi:hypothetical protein